MNQLEIMVTYDESKSRIKYALVIMRVYYKYFNE